ncbi:ribosomal protein L7/L12 [Ornithinimicrobium flavum]|uniref:ribosomal protein L7/L12 n=1 Tax=Ornithinimicrobium flavum TaxID=1288636 RepID=UPI00130543F9|nr:ribosomal protein L7/L12 [Ornithinimicrobium flavum]
MFGRTRQLQQRVTTLQQEVRILDEMVGQLADRAGVDAAELAKLRGSTQPGITPEIRRLVEDGEHIAAIKAYRQRTGAGLKEAKDAVDAYRDGRA